MSFDKHRTKSGRRNGSFSSTDCYDPERRSIDHYDDVQQSRSYGVTRMMSNRSNQVPSGEPRTRYRRSRRVLPIHESRVKIRHFRLFSDSDIPDAPVSRRETSIFDYQNRRWSRETDSATLPRPWKPRTQKQHLVHSTEKENSTFCHFFHQIDRYFFFLSLAFIPSMIASGAPFPQNREHYR